MRKVWIIVVTIAIAVGYYVFDYTRTKAITLYVPPQSKISTDLIYPRVSYESTQLKKYQVEIMSQPVVGVTRLMITPDGEYLLATLLTGELIAYERDQNGFDNTPRLVTKVVTHSPGFPPSEAGLVGMIFSAEYERSSYIYLLHTYKNEEGAIKNRISRTRVGVVKGNLIGSEPEVIFEANIDGAESHQITDGVSVMIEDKPHLLFLIGEGFRAERAQDPTLESGKVMLIQEDGSNPLGLRPDPDNPRIEALGIRNAYTMIRDESDSLGRFVIADTGPDRYDRLIYTTLGTGRGEQMINYGWDGDEEGLLDPIIDPNSESKHDLVMLRLPQTRTFTGLAFVPDTGELLATVFGDTGTPQNSPGKEIWIGRIERDAQPSILFEPLIKRTPESEGSLGNPIGLVVDPITGDIYFADILESRIYKVKNIGG